MLLLTMAAVRRPIVSISEKFFSRLSMPNRTGNSSGLDHERQDPDLAYPALPACLEFELI